MPGSNYYDHTTFPSRGAAGSSSGMRSELGMIEAGFDKLPDLVVANADLPVFLNSAGTALVPVAADSARTKLGTGTNLWCGTATGTANALTLTPTPAVTAYAPGQRFFFKSGAAANTTAVIAAVSGLPAIAVQVNGAACIGGEIAANSWYEVFIDASLTSCQLSKIGRATLTELGISAFAQTILDDANAAAARTTLGAAASGANSDITSLIGLTGPINEARTTLAGNATTTDIWTGQGGSINLTGTPTYTNFAAAPQAGAKRRLFPATGAVFVNAGAFSVVGNANYTVPAGGSVDVEAITTTTFRLVPLNADGRALVGTLDAGPIQAFRNLAGSAPGTSAVVTYTIDELATGDGAGNYQTTRAWNSTITMTSAGASGLDTGTVAASTWYYAFGITKPDGTKALLASLSATAPTLPSGYTKWARIGAFRTDGTANKYPLSFQQYGRNAQYKVAAGSNVTSLPVMASGVSGTYSGTVPVYTAVSTNAYIPATAARIKIVLSANYNGATSSNALIAPNGAYGGPLSANQPPLSTYNGSAVAMNSNGEMVLESGNIYYVSAAAGGAGLCLGWEDNI